MSYLTTYAPETIADVLATYITQEMTYDRADLVLTGDFRLVEQGVIDSLGILRLISFIEERFDVAMEPEDLMLENFATIDAITNFVVRKLNKSE